MKRNRTLFIVIACFVIYFIVFNAVQGKADTILRVLLIILIIALVIVAILLIIGRKTILRRLRLNKIINTKDLDSKIRQLENMLPKGDAQIPLDMANYYSMAYFEKGDYEKALELIHKEAERLIEAKLFNPEKLSFTQDLYKINEVSCLIELDRVDEAVSLLETFDEGAYDDKSYILLGIKEKKAQLAAHNGETALARDTLLAAKEISAHTSNDKQSRDKWAFLLIEATCDYHERDEQAALSKAESVISNCEWGPTVRRARKLKDRINA